MAEILAPFPAPAFPDIYRVARIEREVVATGYRMTADLFHANANPRVTWTVRHPDTRLKAGVLVKPIQMKGPAGGNGLLTIHHLMVLERPEAGLNLFETVPATWVGDHDLLVRAGILWDTLPAHLQGLFNTVFWEGGRFRRFCQGQSSLHGHHDGLSGKPRMPIEGTVMSPKRPFAEKLADSHLNVILNHEARGHMGKDLRRYAYASTFAMVHGVSPKGHEQYSLHGLAPHHKNWQTGYFADRFRVQLWDHPATTVTSHIAKDGHYFIHPDPTQCRSLTVREAARLQTFPDNYFFQGNRTQQFHQVGNAVPPILASLIAKLVANLLNK